MQNKTVKFDIESTIQFTILFFLFAIVTIYKGIRTGIEFFLFALMALGIIHAVIFFFNTPREERANMETKTWVLYNFGKYSVAIIVGIIVLASTLYLLKG